MLYCYLIQYIIPWSYEGVWLVNKNLRYVKMKQSININIVNNCYLGTFPCVSTAEVIR